MGWRGYIFQIKKSKSISPPGVGGYIYRATLMQQKPYTSSLIHKVIYLKIAEGWSEKSIAATSKLRVKKNQA